MTHVQNKTFFENHLFLNLLTSAQRSAEVRESERALSFYLHFYLSFGVCVSAVCGLRFTDLRRVAFSCKQRFQFISVPPDKAIKQSRDLSVCHSLLIMNNTSTSKL